MGAKFKEVPSFRGGEWEWIKVGTILGFEQMCWKMFSYMMTMPFLGCYNCERNISSVKIASNLRTATEKNKYIKRKHEHLRKEAYIFVREDIKMDEKKWL